jgi:hypothetical protein
MGASRHRPAWRAGSGSDTPPRSRAGTPATGFRRRLRSGHRGSSSEAYTSDPGRATGRARRTSARRRTPAPAAPPTAARRPRSCPHIIAPRGARPWPATERPASAPVRAASRSSCGPNAGGSLLLAAESNASQRGCSSRARSGRRPGAQGETSASATEQSWGTAWRTHSLLSRTRNRRPAAPNRRPCRSCTRGIQRRRTDCSYPCRLDTRVLMPRGRSRAAPIAC